VLLARQVRRAVAQRAAGQGLLPVLDGIAVLHRTCSKPLSGQHRQNEGQALRKRQAPNSIALDVVCKRKTFVRAQNLSTPLLLARPAITRCRADVGIPSALGALVHEGIRALASGGPRPTNGGDSALWRTTASQGILNCMATPITIDIPHHLGRAEARRRIEAGFTKMINQLPGVGGTCTENWQGDQLTFSVSAVGQTIAGVVDVRDTTVSMKIELTGILGMMASRLKDRLQKAGQLLLIKR